MITNGFLGGGADVGRAAGPDWRLAFLFCLVAPLAKMLDGGTVEQTVPTKLAGLAVAGLLVDGSALWLHVGARRLRTGVAAPPVAGGGLDVHGRGLRHRLGDDEHAHRPTTDHGRGPLRHRLGHTRLPPRTRLAALPLLAPGTLVFLPAMLAGLSIGSHCKTLAILNSKGAF